MQCGPPWMTTNSGYFFFGSNAGGLITKLWICLPRLDVNQNSSAGSMSIAAARSVLKFVSACHFPDDRSTRPISCGCDALDQIAATEGAAAVPPTAKRPYVPTASLPISETAP